MSDLTEKQKAGELPIKINRWTILSYHHTAKNYHKYYLCRCDCGKEKIVNINNIIKGVSKSCGCLISETTSERNKTIKQKDKHKYKDYSLYRVWLGMRKRCYSSKEPAYKDYGGRGIFVCDEWRNDYNSFLNWSLINGYKKGLSIDRIDNNKGYTPDNCRFVDNYMQANNKRNNIILELKGEKKTLPNWAREFNISAKKLYARYYRNKNPQYVFKGII